MEEKNQTDFFAQYQHRLVNYVNNLLLLGRLQVTSKISKLLSMLIIWAVVTMLVSLVVLFGSFCAAYYFSDLFDSNMKGFGLVAVIYIAFTAVVLFLGKNKIKQFITNQIINIIFEKTTNDDDEKAEDKAE